MRARAVAAALALALVSPVGARATEHDADLLSYVDPFIGTLGAGFVFPGPAAPYGLVQLSPDTEGIFAYTGYQYSDRYIRGFSHVHTQSMGVREGGQIPIMPVAGPPGTTDVKLYQQPFSHASETAEPGYYSVDLGLGSTPIEVELTAGLRAGMHRYRFPAGTTPSVLLDIGRQINGGGSGLDGQTPGIIPADVTILDAQRLVVGTANAGATDTRQYTVHFAARFSKPFATAGVWESRGAPVQNGVRTVDAPGAGAAVSFAPEPSGPTTVLVEVGISFVDQAGALANLDAEVAPYGHFAFDQMRARTRAAWAEALRAIVVSGGTDADKRSFYTALYHAQHHPNVFNDADGRYLGHDKLVHRIGAEGDAMPAGSTYYANFSLWDTYRAEMPLLALIAPDRYRDFMRSFAAVARYGGRIPRWSWMANHADFMNGEPGLQAFAEGYCRGLVPPETLEEIYANARALAMDPARHRNPEFLERGYTAPPRTDASATLEHAIGDFALALVADRLGRTEDRDALLGLADNWRNLLDPETRFMRPRLADGSWMGAPYRPELPDGWREGTGWQYTWLVPHDARALFDAIGASPQPGDAFVASRLDEFFSWPAAATAPHATAEAQQKATAYGLAYYGNQYAPSNEHDLQAPWMYNWLGQPWKTQALARTYQSLYRPTPDGLPGNDDLGTMSAWFVWSALGFYPNVPGSPTYTIGSPVFERAVVRVPGGSFTVEAPLASAAVKYVHGVTAGGVELHGPWFDHSAFAPGSTISFEMLPAPDPTWGSARADAPPSMTTHPDLRAFACRPA